MTAELLFAFDDIIKELPTLHVLHNQEQLLWCLDYLVQLDDVGMPDQL